MNKISGKELNLLKTLEILKSNRFVSFYHFNNLSKREWDAIKLQLRKIETQDIPSNKSQGENKERKGRTRGLPLSNLSLERTALVQSKISLLLKTSPTVLGITNKDIKDVTTKRELKTAKVELLVLKSKAVVKALYPFLFYSHRCPEVKQTVYSYPLALRAEQNIGKPLLRITSVGKKLDLKPKKVKQVVLNVSNSLLPEKGACKANNQLGKDLNKNPADRTNSLIKAFHLVEGPTLLVGASTIEGFKESARQLEKEKSLLFVGGVLENQFINHLDLKDCLNTFLPTSANLLQTFNYLLMIPPLNYYSNRLLFLLQKRQKSLKEV